MPSFDAVQESNVTCIPNLIRAGTRQIKWLNTGSRWQEHAGDTDSGARSAVSFDLTKQIWLACRWLTDSKGAVDDLYSGF